MHIFLNRIPLQTFLCICTQMFPEVNALNACARYTKRLKLLKQFLTNLIKFCRLVGLGRKIYNWGRVSATSRENVVEHTSLTIEINN